MARAPLTVWEKELRSAARELGQPKCSWTVERYATLTVALKLARSKWATGNISGSADLLALMAEISAMRASVGLDAPREITVRFVDGLVARCPKCGHMTDIDEDKLRAVTKVEGVAEAPTAPTLTQQAPNGSAGPSTDGPPPAPAVPKPAVPVSVQRAGVSASAFHSQLLNGHEVAPIKRNASRLISPLSVTGY